jgi:hypothetical protein
MASSSTESALKPTIIFVPFYGGRAPSLRRHFEFVESLGLKWKFVELPFIKMEFLKSPFSSGSLASTNPSGKFHFGLKSIWADRIEKCLNETPGPKIIFSFSTPSSGAIEAIARRYGNDIQALIVDGGPTGELFRSIYTYYKSENRFFALPVRLAMALTSAYLLDLDQKNFCHNDLNIFPADFPVLSIRGWKDEIITPRQIDLIFTPHSQLRWQKLAIPEGGHLNGLRDFPSIYTEGVKRFLSDLSARHIS